MTTTYTPVGFGLIGNLDHHTTVHEDSGRDFTDRTEALAWGEDYYGHDDFRIATKVDGRLTAIGVKLRDFGPGEEDLAQIAGQLGLELAEVAGAEA
jgi:hypothetical protein